MTLEYLIYFLLFKLNYINNFDKFIDEDLLETTKSLREPCIPCP